MNKNVTDAIKDFYTNNFKLGYDSYKHDIRLSSLQKNEVETLASLVCKFNPVTTLEIGLAMGASAIAIAASKLGQGIQEPHIVLDPYQHTRARDAGLIEIKRLGYENAIRFHPRFSEDFLNECFQKGQQFDFIFIDGSHTIGQAVTDAFLSDKILKAGGIIAVHDALLFSTAASIKYLIWQCGYRVVQDWSLSIKTLGRIIKYSNRLGLWYAWNVIPRISKSLTALQKVK